MSTSLLLDLLTQNIKLEEFEQWIAGSTTKNIGNNVNRSEFVLYVLNFIQDQASSLLDSGSNGKTQVKNNENSQNTKCLPSDSDTKSKTLIDHNTQLPGVAEGRQNMGRTSTIHDVRSIPDKCSHEQRIANSSPFNNTELLTDSNRNTSPKHNSYRILDLSGHSGPTVNKSFQISQLDSGSRPVCHSTSTSINTSQTGLSGLSSSPDGSLSSIPVSSSYVENFPELGSTTKNQRKDKRQNSITLGDFIVNQKQNIKLQVNRKRIKPTKLTSFNQNDEDMKSCKSDFGVVSRPFASLPLPCEQPVSVVESQRNYDQERHMLKEKRSKPVKEPVGSSTVFLLKRKSKTKLINPNPKAVTFQNSVTCLANIYCILLDYNMVPNITAEVHFIFSLLSIKSSGEESILKKGLNDVCVEDCEEHKCCDLSPKAYLSDSDSNKENKSVKHETSDHHADENIKHSLLCTSNGYSCNSNFILGSIHNCVWFASVVIQGQTHLIQNADRTTLKLLIENERLKLFLPNIIPQLLSAYQNKDITTNDTSFTEIWNALLPHETVKYETETDNCEYFSTIKGFNNFRKQRDLFYECLSLWQSKHLQPSWNFESALTSKILRLLSLSSDPVNMMHLVRLFCTQLVNSTINKDQKEDIIDRVDVFGLNKNKLSRLQARLVQPPTKSEPRPTSQFPDDQCFYQQFVEVACANTLFSTHLTDCLIQRIVQLNNTCFDSDYENGSHDEMRYKFLICLKTSNLLAKFLGLIVFSPYRNVPAQPPDIIETEILVRQEVQPPINVLMFIQNASKSGRLVITIPWVTEYLGMMDSVSFYLPYYKNAFQILFCVYKNVSPRLLQNGQFTIQKYESDIIRATSQLNITDQEENGVCKLAKNAISSHSALLLRLCLGWLFDTSFFPEKLFFSLASDFLQVNTTKLVSYGAKDSIDTSDLVDERILFECCPYFTRIKLPLLTSSGTKSGTVRHITPVTAQFEKPSESYTATALEFQLEESFLSGQASSFRSTIEFVIDRIASACIKHICSNVIAPYKENILAEFEIFQAQTNKQGTRTSIKEQLVETAENEVNTKIHDTLNEYCGVKIKTALFSLLGPDTLDSGVSTVGLQIASRKCREKIIHWLHNHINLKDIFTKVVSESRSADMYQPAPSRNVEHTDDVISPPQTLINIKETLCGIIENGGEAIKEHDVKKLLRDILVIGRHRGDLVIAAEKLIKQLSIDLSVILIAYRPELMSKEVISLLMSIWQTKEFSVLREDNPLVRILCNRNIFLLCQGETSITTKVWSRLSDFLYILIMHDLLSPEQLEAQCVGLLRQSWPPVVLKLVADCLKSTLEKLKNETTFTNDPKIMLMLEWVNETMRELSE